MNAPRFLILGIVIAAAAALAGCSSQAYKSPASGALDTGVNGPRHVADPLRMPTFPTTAPAAVATSRPETVGANEDLERSVALISRLDFPAARTLLMGLEGRLLLARDLDHAAQAAFWMAFCDEKMELPDKAAAEYARLIDRYPQSPQARTANDRLNRLRPTHARAVPPS